MDLPTTTLVLPHGVFLKRIAEMHPIFVSMCKNHNYIASNNENLKKLICRIMRQGQLVNIDVSGSEIESARSARRFHESLTL